MNGLLSAALRKFKAAQTHVDEAERLENEVTRLTRILAEEVGKVRGYITGAEALRVEVARLEALVHVPGWLVCKKCSFGLSKRTIFMGSGTIGANNEPDHCPNDGAPLWRVTERQMREDQFKDLLQIRNRTLEDVAVMADEVLLKAFAEKVRERKTEEG